MNSLILSGAGAVLLSLLIGAAGTRGLLVRVDEPLMEAGAMVAGETPGWAIRMAQMFTHMGDPGFRSVIVIGLAAFLIGRQNVRVAALYVATCFVTIAAYTVAKRAYMRPRPHLTPWLAGPTDPSFPSGHAAGATVVLLLAAMLIEQRGLVPTAFALATGIGLSRIAMGVHWPSDVLGGWLFGGGAALIGYAIAMRMATLPALMP